jgi:hypothetical protein
MTPTLFGRWQTRILLLSTVGPFVTFFFAILAFVLYGTVLDFFKPFILLILVIVFGIGWDVLFNFLQKLRWDRDWPPAFFLIAAFIEMFPVMLVGLLLQVPPIFFLFHYWFVWWSIFIAMQGPMKIIFPRWRYRGGQWL